MSSTRAVAGLSPEQQSVLHTLVNQGNRSGASPSDKLSAVETGLVESRLTNPAGGDGTSVGWRQETASSYPNVNRMNVKQSAARFYNELKSAPPGTPGQRAQDVQRSAYPGRYDQVQGQAQQLLKASSVKPNPKDTKALAKAGIKSGKKESPSGHATPYANPVPGQPQGRSDQGVDYGLPSGSPVVAVGKGKVVSTTRTGAGAGWPGGQGVIYKLTKGPQAGKNIFVFEQFAPTVNPGQKVRKGQVIGKGIGGSIETGYYDVGGNHPLNNTIPGGATYSVASSDGVQTVGSAQFSKQILGKAGAVRITGGNAPTQVVTALHAAGFSPNGQPITQKTKAMSPHQRQMALMSALSRALRSYGGAASVLPGGGSTSTSTPKLTGKPVL